MTELKRIEKSVNAVVGMPITWAVYGGLLFGRCCYHGIIRGGTWLRSRYARA